MVSDLAPSILVVDDEPASVSLLRISLSNRFQVHTATSGTEALELLACHPEIAVAIIDQRMHGMTGTQLIERTVSAYPRLIRIILTGYTDLESLIAAINTGAVYRYLTKPWRKEELLGVIRQGLEVHRLALENELLHDKLRQAYDRLSVENVHLKRVALARHRFDQIIGTSAALQRTLDLVERIVPTTSTALILGETGTGKELIARAIHYNGPRADQPFVSENCGAIAPDLLSSELFGHRKGSFTGAIEDRQGLFEVASGGTLFLDEIGDCSPDLQTRLLRVLDQGEIRRVGDNQAIKVDVRLLAATHHDLEADVAAGRFRKDLFYRLSVFSVRTPPLRERREDVAVLAQHFLELHNRGSNKKVHGLSRDAVALLSAYDFPGNIRELENEIERAFALADDDGFIVPEVLSDRFRAQSPESESISTLRDTVERFEAQLVRNALEANAGNQTRTAVELGLSRRGLIDKLQKYRII